MPSTFGIIVKRAVEGVESNIGTEMKTVTVFRLEKDILVKTHRCKSHS